MGGSFGLKSFSAESFYHREVYFSPGSFYRPEVFHLRTVFLSSNSLLGIKAYRRVAIEELFSENSSLLGSVSLAERAHRKVIFSLK